MRLSNKLLTAIAAVQLTTCPAIANTLTETINFSAKNFTVLVGAPVSVPTDPVTGSFTITLNPTQTYTADTSGITLNSLNITLGSTLAFWYSGPTADQLIVGGVSDGSAVLSGSDDFFLEINLFPANVTPVFMVYTTSADCCSAFGSSSITATNGAPGPIVGAGLPSFVLLAGAAALLGWRMKRKAAASMRH